MLITHEPEVAEHADRTIHIRDGLITDAKTAFATDQQLALLATEASADPEASDAQVRFATCSPRRFCP